MDIRRIGDGNNDAPMSICKLGIRNKIKDGKYQTIH
jgi:hypothetical protein